MMDVTLLGTGGVMPLPDRALTSAYIRCEGAALLIDCGEGTQTAIRRWGLRFKPISAILLSHFHADHISGLPGLLLTMGNEGRTEEVTLFGPTGLGNVVRALMTIVSDLPFPVRVQELPVAAPFSFSCMGLTVTAIPLHHSIPCLGYLLEKHRPGKFDPQAAMAKGIPLPLWSRLQRGESLGGFCPEDVLGAPRKGLRLLYATDTRPVPDLQEYGQDADLLILEGMFGDPEKQQRAHISCHMTMQEAADIARLCNAKALWLTHYSPATPHPEEYAEAIHCHFPRTTIAADGQHTLLRFEDPGDDHSETKEGIPL